MPGQHRRQPLSGEEDRLRAALARHREEQRISQRALSERLGMHPMTVGKIERGERSVSVIELLRLANALGIAAADLLAEMTRVV